MSQTRDCDLADEVLQQVRRCSRKVCALLVCTDGWSAYPNSIRRAFREKMKRTARRGRCALAVWPELHIGTVIKRPVKKHLTEVIRQMTQGSFEAALKLLECSRGGTMLNTSFIERFNGTMRERLATLTRKCRHATAHPVALQAGMYLLGATYNFCWPHQELSCMREHGTGKRHHVRACTPAMAAHLTDHVWSVYELLSYKVVPAPWVAPRRRGRPRTRPSPDPMQPKRPRGHPRKQVPCATTS